VVAVLFGDVGEALVAAARFDRAAFAFGPSESFPVAGFGVVDTAAGEVVVGEGALHALAVEGQRGVGLGVVAVEYLIEGSDEGLVGELDNEPSEVYEGVRVESQVG
jgi:hypothetical protein